jgi:hypothetical protein
MIHIVVKPKIPGFIFSILLDLYSCKKNSVYLIPIIRRYEEPIAVIGISEEGKTFASLYSPPKSLCYISAASLPSGSEWNKN